MFPDHVRIPGRSQPGHSDQRAEGDLQVGQLRVHCVPLRFAKHLILLFSLIDIYYFTYIYDVLQCLAANVSEEEL